MAWHSEFIGIGIETDEMVTAIIRDYPAFSNDWFRCVYLIGGIALLDLLKKWFEENIAWVDNARSR